MTFPMSDARRHLFCAIDTDKATAALSLGARLADKVGGLKLGLEFFGAEGPAGVRAVAALGLPVFLDLKLHDIPNTVAKAVTALVPLRPFMMTIHTAGGLHMMTAAAEAAKDAAAKHGVPAPILVGVTVLTSLNGDDLAAVGVSTTPEAQVLRLATLARQAGLDGVVCSAAEIAPLRRALGSDFTLVVPGIRPKGADVGDQKRVMTPREAMAAGASFLVVGRPITGAPDPAAAADAIVAEMTS